MNLLMTFNVTKILTIELAIPIAMKRSPASASKKWLNQLKNNTRRMILFKYVINMPILYFRRIEVCLNYLNRADKLAKAIALNKDLPLCGKDNRLNSSSTLLSTDSVVKDLPHVLTLRLINMRDKRPLRDIQSHYPKIN